MESIALYSSQAAVDAAARCSPPLVFVAALCVESQVLVAFTFCASAVGRVVFKSSTDTDGMAQLGGGSAVSTLGEGLPSNEGAYKSELLTEGA